tara:strand:+ start:445 stop:738 length:294 start_codon:yes stop_codon:yes gene_type:complete
MNSPFNVYRLADSCNKIEGFSLIKELLNPNEIIYSDCFTSSIEEVINEYTDWPEGQGFGSSDGTYAKKSFIDYMIEHSGLYSKLKTVFSPYLSVTKI